MQIGNSGGVLYASQTINRLNEVLDARNAQVTQILKVANEKAQQVKTETINTAIDAQARSAKVLGNIVDVMA